MARILVFDNDPQNLYGHTDTRGNTVPYLGKGLGTVGAITGNGLSVSRQDPARTYPVRIFTSGDEIRYVGWEFLLHHSGLPVGATIVFKWWQEFYNDRSLQIGEGVDAQGRSTEGVHGGIRGQKTSPFGRDWVTIPNTYPWMRETALVDAGTNTDYNNRDLNIYAVQRSMQMQSRNATPSPVEGKNADSLYVPLAVHASWARIALYASQSESNAAGQAALEAGAVHLKVYANLGGHSEIRALETETYAQRPYAYDAQVDGAASQS